MVCVCVDILQFNAKISMQTVVLSFAFLFFQFFFLLQLLITIYTIYNNGNHNNTSNNCMSYNMVCVKNSRMNIYLFTSESVRQPQYFSFLFHHTQRDIL